jgi:hypothetical protein
MNPSPRILTNAAGWPLWNVRYGVGRREFTEQFYAADHGAAVAYAERCAKDVTVHMGRTYRVVDVALVVA